MNFKWSAQADKHIRDLHVICMDFENCPGIWIIHIWIEQDPPGGSRLIQTLILANFDSSVQFSTPEEKTCVILRTGWTKLNFELSGTHLCLREFLTGLGSNKWQWFLDKGKRALCICIQAGTLGARSNMAGYGRPQNNVNWLCFVPIGRIPLHCVVSTYSHNVRSPHITFHPCTKPTVWLFVSEISLMFCSVCKTEKSWRSSACLQWRQSVSVFLGNITLRRFQSV